MQRLEVSGAVRPIYGSLGVKRLIYRNASLLEDESKAKFLDVTYSGFFDLILRELNLS